MPSFETGPYGFYIWTSYGLSALVIGWLTVDSLLRSRRWRKAAEARKGAVYP